MTCFRYVIVHTLHKSDKKDGDDDDYDNNNNVKPVGSINFTLVPRIFLKAYKL